MTVPAQPPASEECPACGTRAVATVHTAHERMYGMGGTFADHDSHEAVETRHAVEHLMESLENGGTNRDLSALAIMKNKRARQMAVKALKNETVRKLVVKQVSRRLLKK